MALIELNLDPTERDLKWFGVLALAFFALVGGVVFAVSNAIAFAVILWTLGATFCAIFYSVKPLQRIMYRGWLRLFQPIGWVIAHVLFGFIFYVVFTLIGLGLKLFRYDPMQLRRDPSATTYWAEHKSASDSSRYFRQF